MTSQHLKFLMTPAQHRQWAANARRRNRPDLAQHHELRRQRLDAFGLKRELLAAGIRIGAGIHNKAPRTTCRPASVILTRATSIGLPAATMCSACADASLAWISSTSSSAVNPFASKRLIGLIRRECVDAPLPYASLLPYAGSEVDRSSKGSGTQYGTRDQRRYDITDNSFVQAQLNGTRARRKMPPSTATRSPSRERRPAPVTR